ncbi:MAG TPA: hypothetical protein VGI17_00670 [Solirubrobacterales bacterium]
MNGPSEELREHVALTLDEVTDEEQLEEILGTIEEELSSDLGGGPRDEQEEMAAIDAWAGLASYAVGRFYAPASPWPFRKGGWDKRAPERLRRIADQLRGPLERVARALGAVTWSISVGFPWGVSISVSWP